MAQVRYKRDGTKTVANTIYLKEETDLKAAKLAKAKSVNHRKVSKSQVIVETVEKHL